MTELIPEYDARKSFYGRAMICEGKNGWYLYSYDTEVFFIPFDNGDDNEEEDMMQLRKAVAEFMKTADLQVFFL